MAASPRDLPAHKVTCRFPDRPYDPAIFMRSISTEAMVFPPKV